MSTWSEPELQVLQRGWNRGELSMTLPIDCPHCMHPDGRPFEAVIVPAYSLSTGSRGAAPGDAADDGDGLADDADLDYEATDDADETYAEPSFPTSYVVECRCADSSHGENGGCGRTGRVPTGTLP